MCGIFGYVGGEPRAARIVMGGLERLEYRGYDSWGVAVALSGRLAVQKDVGRIAGVATTLPPSQVALGHTRWATHGGVEPRNAHPHLDCRGRLALIHNGIVENERALRSDLAARGHAFASLTDSELVAHLVEEELGEATGPDALVRAVRAAFLKLHGLNAIAVLDAATGLIAAAKNGSPLVLGWSDGAALLASDAAALAPHTRRVTYVDDGQAVLLTPAGSRLYDLASGAELTPAVHDSPFDPRDADRAGHPDWMTKEIREQPAVLRRLAAADPAPIRHLAALVRAADTVILTGCGSAGHAALAGQYLIARAGCRVTSVAASELAHFEAFLSPRALVVALSQSGETMDVIEAAKRARALGAKVAALVNVPGSTLARMADAVVPLDAGPERAVLATKSFTAKLAVLMLLAAELSGSPAPDLAAAADEIADLLDGPRRALIGRIASEVHGRAHLFAIGRGMSYPLALEAALKIKEASYLHAEGFAGGELKHGVIALVEPGTPCLVMAPPDATYDAVMAGAMEVRARGGRLIGIASAGHDAFDRSVPVANLGPTSPLVHAIPGQLLGYDLARLAGHDPDRPRNLAKSVTVR